MSVLVVVEHDRGQMADATLEAFAFGADIAAQLGVGVEALLIGTDAAGLADTCAAHGASVVHHASDASLADYGPDAYGEVVAAAASALSPSAIVACGSDRGNEVLAYAAATLDLPFVANCLTVKTADEWEATRVQWGGSLNEDARLASSMPILSVAPHAVDAADPVSGAAATVHALDAPAIGVVPYMERLGHYSYCSAPVLLMAYRYMERVAAATPDGVPGVAADELTVHRLMIASVVLAAKTHDDDFLSNHHYALVGGLPLDELNALEVGLLQLLRWRTMVGEEEFADVERRVSAAVDVEVEAPPAKAAVALVTRKPAPGQSSPTGVQAAAADYQSRRWPTTRRA